MYVYAEMHVAPAIGPAYSYPIRIYLLNPALQNIITAGLDCRSAIASRHQLKDIISQLHVKLNFIVAHA